MPKHRRSPSVSRGCLGSYYIEACKWFSIAAQRGLEIAIKNRNELAKKLCPEDLDEAGKLAQQWIEQFEQREK
jgi:hypothetical protein